LGTGAAGPTAAVTAHEGGASVAVFEKADKVGVTTAWSGGQVWIPNNPHMADVGVADSRDKAITYIMSLSRDMLEQRLVEAYVEAGPEMVELLEAKTVVQFHAVPGMPDYHPEFPGGSPGGGRDTGVPDLPVRRARRVGGPRDPVPVLRRPSHHDERDAIGQGRAGAPFPGRYARRKVRNERGCGQALAGRLLHACLARGIEPRTSCAAASC
jgi:succinate dehydrogenase/fumarate reductase flavoprotein subunit